MRGATVVSAQAARRSLFQSTRPMRGATASKSASTLLQSNFNPCAPCGARRGQIMHYYERIRISIHAPHAGRDRGRGVSVQGQHYFNPRAPCGARRRSAWSLTSFPKISIHAPHAGRDGVHHGPAGLVGGISIHAPHAGRDEHKTLRKRRGNYFNPRAPCGARPSVSFASGYCSRFQSTRPMRGATRAIYVIIESEKISIHAPHAGRDALYWYLSGWSKYFNPRAPCGARLAVWSRPLHPKVISIHAPHAGRDCA